MADPIITLADGVKDALNGAGLGFTSAVRDYLPTINRDELEDMQVFVIPAGETIVAASRASTAHDYVIDVGVIKPLSVGEDNSFDKDELDACRNTVNSIKQWAKFKQVGTASWQKTENDPLFIQEHLDTNRQFTSVVKLTFRDFH